MIGLASVAAVAWAAAIALDPPREAYSPNPKFGMLHDAPIMRMEPSPDGKQLLVHYVGDGGDCDQVSHVDVTPDPERVVVRVWAGPVRPSPADCGGTRTLEGHSEMTKVDLDFDLADRPLVDGHRGQFLGPDGPQNKPPTR